MSRAELLLYILPCAAFAVVVIAVALGALFGDKR